MRHNRQPGTKSESHQLQLLARIFSPNELEVDALAEALRGLLADGVDRHSAPDSPLLSSSDRGTHVVEEQEAS